MIDLLDLFTDKRRIDRVQLIIIRGNSGSGKTTTAKYLQTILGRNTMLLSQDVIRRDVLFTPDGPETVSILLIYEMVQYGRTVCPYIIVEGIFKASWYSQMFKALSGLCQDNVLTYYFDLPFEETLNRHQTREKIKKFGEPEMRRWWNEKDYLEGPNEVLFTEEHSPKDILEKITDDLFFSRPSR